ncbi:hypothetical protein J6590_081050 [Homalodisca vitripennis]|nr:hypothetical protein J6590_081050 [Homalodisca vitripennis]
MQPPPSLMFSANSFRDSPKGFTPWNTAERLRARYNIDAEPRLARASALSFPGFLMTRNQYTSYFIFKAATATDQSLSEFCSSDKNGTMAVVDLEVLKALVEETPGVKIVTPQVGMGVSRERVGGEAWHGSMAVIAHPSGKQRRGSSFRQVVAALFANLGTINTGMMFGFSAVTIPQLKQPDSLIPIDENEASWIGKTAKFN